MKKFTKGTFLIIRQGGRIESVSHLRLSRLDLLARSKFYRIFRCVLEAKNSKQRLEVASEKCLKLPIQDPLRW